MNYQKLLPGESYHVFGRANGEESLFLDSTDYHFFSFLMSKHLPSQFDLQAFCLLPNHYHLLLTVHEGNHETQKKSRMMMENNGYSYHQNSLQIRKILMTYAIYYNKKYCRKGSLFMRPFRRKKILNDNHFSKIIHYIHANPVHHGYVNSIMDWAYSSFSHIISNSPTYVNRGFVINWFGSIDAYKAFHLQPIGRKKDGIYLEEL